MKTRLLKLAAIVAFFILLLTPQVSIGAARSGLILWANTVVPSLLPSMILTSFLVQTGATSMISRVAYPLFSRLFGLSREGSFCIVSGIFCGYPMGAKTASDLLCEGRIEESEANFLLAICAYPSPMFILGYVMERLNSPEILPLFLAAIYLPPALFGIIMGRLRAHTRQNKPKVRLFPVSIRFEVFERCVISSCETIIKIGALMMLFSILSEWVKLIPCLSTTNKLLVSPFLEMTTGVNAVARSDFSPMYRAMLCVFATSFGGLCTYAQTCSVLKDEKLSKSKYLVFKLLHGVLSSVTYLLLIQIRI